MNALRSISLASDSLLLHLEEDKPLTPLEEKALSMAKILAHIPQNQNVKSLDKRSFTLLKENILAVKRIFSEEAEPEKLAELFLFGDLGKDQEAIYNQLIAYAGQKRLSPETITKIVKFCEQSDKFQINLKGVWMNRLLLASKSEPFSRYTGVMTKTSPPCGSSRKFWPDVEKLRGKRGAAFFARCAGRGN